MNEELKERFYRLLVECNAVEAFVALAKDMGEKAARTVALYFRLRVGKKSN